MAKPRPEVSLRLSFGGQAPKLDERTVRLLELIELRGSILQAARALGISYRTAWILVDGLKTCGAGSVVSAFHGGPVNGSRLTPAGRALIEQFRATERELAVFIDQFNRGLPLENSRKVGGRNKHL